MNDKDTQILAALRPREHGVTALTLTAIGMGILLAREYSVALLLAAALGLLGLPLREAVRKWRPRRSSVSPGVLWGLLAVTGGVSALLIRFHPETLCLLLLLAGVLGVDRLALRHRWYRNLFVELLESTGVLFLLWLLLLTGQVPVHLRLYITWGIGAYLVLTFVLVRGIRMQTKTRAFHALWFVLWFLVTALSPRLLPLPAARFLSLWTFQQGVLACFLFRNRSGPRSFRRLGWYLVVQTAAFALGWIWLW